MAVALVDSNVFIDCMRKSLNPAKELMRHADSTDLAICGMVRMEVLRGVRDAKFRDALGAFMDVMRFVPTDNNLWNEATMLAWSLDRRGVTLPAQDLIIAACAMRIGASVLTYDHHFDQVPGLIVMHSLSELS